jgi:hypothetical protein
MPLNLTERDDGSLALTADEAERKAHSRELRKFGGIFDREAKLYIFPASEKARLVKYINATNSAQESKQSIERQARRRAPIRPAPRAPPSPVARQPIVNRISQQSILSFVDPYKDKSVAVFGSVDPEAIEPFTAQFKAMGGRFGKSLQFGALRRPGYYFRANRKDEVKMLVEQINAGGQPSSPAPKPHTKVGRVKSKSQRSSKVAKEQAKQLERLLQLVEELRAESATQRSKLAALEERLSQLSGESLLCRP